MDAVDKRSAAVASASTATTIYALPDELIVRIFSELNPKSLLACQRVSRSWKINASADHLWRALTLASHGWLTRQLPAVCSIGEASTSIRGTCWSRLPTTRPCPTAPRCFRCGINRPLPTRPSATSHHGASRSDFELTISKNA